MSFLSCKLLGTFQITIDGNPIVINASRQRELIAFLLLHRDKPQSRQQIAFCFWPDRSEKQVRTNLRQLLHHLRQDVPLLGSFIQSEEGQLQWRLDSNFELDIADFEASIAYALAMGKDPGDRAEIRNLLEKAIDQYVGDLLPDCYTDWALHERERLRILFVDGLDRLITLLEEERDYTQAIRYTQQLLRHDPLHEKGYGRLMRLHALAGDLTAVQCVYEECSAVLAQELGVTPSQETQQLRDQLLHATAIAAHQGPVSESVQTDLVGRHVEWQKLLATWHQVASGQSEMVVIVGEAGIGKTRLAESFSYWIECQGVVAVHTRSYAAEGDLAYGPVIDWLRSHMLATYWQNLENVWLIEIARLLPELLIMRPDLPRPEPLTEHWQRQRMFEALALAITANDTPLLLVLDDLQWSDADTLQFLRYLLRFDGQAKLLIVGTIRPEEVGAHHPLTELLLTLRTTGQLTEIELGPLNAEETAALADQTAHIELNSAEQQRLFDATEGNPLFVVETIRSETSFLDETGDFGFRPSGTSNPQSFLPPKIYASIQRRLNQLSPIAREIASTAAVIGRRFLFGVLHHISDYAERELARGLDELQQRRIIRIQGLDGYDFSHDRIRDVAYSEVGQQTRRLLHRKVATVLQQIETGEIESLHAQLGFHLEQADEPELAIHHYRKAADHAIHVQAFESAHHYLQRTISLLEQLPDSPDTIRHKIDVLNLLAHQLITLRGFTSSERKLILDEAYRLAQRLNEPKPLVDIQISRHTYYANSGRWDIAYQLSQEVLPLAESLQAPDNLATVYHQWASTLLQTGECINSITFYRKAQELYPTRTWKMIGSLGRLAENLWLAGYPQQAGATAQKVLHEIQSEKSPLIRVHGQDYVSNTYQQLGMVKLVDTFTSDSIGLCDQYGLPDYRWSASLLQGWVMVKCGKVIQAIAQMEYAIQTLVETSCWYQMPYYLSLLAEAYTENKQVYLAIQTLERALQESDRIGDRLWLAELHRLQGEYKYQQNQDICEAETCYQQAITIASQQQAKSLELRGVMSLARLWQQQGKRQKAHDILAESYNWFSEGFDTTDLIAAKKLLQELS